MMKRRLLLLVATALLCAPALQTAADDAATEDAWRGATVDDGRRIFRSLCAGCHGTKGDGQGPAADALDLPPRDLVRAEYRFRSTASGDLPTRADMVRTLAIGLPGTPMPSWRQQLDARELRSVVLYLETLSPRFADQYESREMLVDEPALNPPDPTPDLLIRGRGVYEKLQCGKCHGAEGRGDGEAADTLENNDGRAADVFDFSYGTYKGGIRAPAVYRTFVTGLDGTPMPSYADSVPDETDRWALVLYCLSLTRTRGLWFYMRERPTWEEPTAEE